ncbi:MAG: CPBP family glutamic-type intramembrane protease [Myxococcota bacterium]|nr:CPBP family glutamic-type intramembrane protease [Myxococcota bacterium]
MSRGASPSWTRLALGVAGASVTLAVALALRGAVNIWLATGAFAAISLPLLLALWGPAARRALRPRPRRLLWGAVAGVALAAASHLLHPLACALVPSLEPAVRGLYAELAAPPGPVAALPVLGVVVLTEELAWRGPLLERLAGRLGEAGGLAAHLAVYTAPQLVSASPVLIALALGCGLVWGALRLRLGGMDAAFACHLVWAVLVFVAFPVTA